MDFSDDDFMAESAPEENSRSNTKVKIESDSDDEAPLITKTKVLPKAIESSPGTSPEKKPKSNGKKRQASSETSDEEISLMAKRKAKSKKVVKKEPTTPVKPKKEVKVKKESPKKEGEEEQDEEEYKWWLNQDKDDSVKWKTLEHNGPTFPPEYEPHAIKMKYDGSEVYLEPEAEEVATFFAALIGTDWAENPTFCKNFFADFLSVCKNQSKPCPIKEFEKCDFSPITEYLQRLKDQKKQMTKQEKEEVKAKKQEIDDKYGWCVLDGRKEKVGNFRIEPPGLFRGRGEHPKTGSLKLRVRPEQVTINIGHDATIPEPPKGHKWGQIIHDNTVTWLAMWKENVNDNIKYVFLAANSSLKGQSDLKKFEKARELKNHVDRIRADYTAELRDKVMAVRQRATAMYLIDRLALRAGNEKGEDEADTVGCCSLRVEHISLEPPNKVIFDFLGKDSIRYYNEVSVDEQVFKNLKLFKREPKVGGDPLFDRLNTAILNKHLSNYMKGLTAKVFRTFNASFTFQKELVKTPEDGSVHEKVLAYNRANRQVAVLCNHQRSIPKSHGNQVNKMQDKIKALKYERDQTRQQLFEADPKFKKNKNYHVEESDLDEEFIERYKMELEKKEEEKLIKKLEKENEKRKEDGEKELTIEDVRKSESKKTKSVPSVDRLEKKYDSLTDKIKAQKLLLVDKDEGKTTALSTSKINYIDPRISVAWCYKYEVPVEKIFNRSLREKFKWAFDLDKDWSF